MTPRVLFFTAIFFACAVAALRPVRADSPSPPPSPAPSAAATPAESPPPPDVSTHHTTALDGRNIPYTATAGTITLRDDEGEATASMFYVAYAQDGVTDLSRRPVTFFYNGGPGAGTIWLHMGSFGPKRVVVGNAGTTHGPPYQLADNEYGLLDKSDLVFIDAPATGFSRLVGKSKPKDFFGIDKDAAAFGQFIQRYLTANKRWNSPKFLFGESYGTTRSCALVQYLQRHEVAVNGVVLLSAALNFLQFQPGDGNDMPYLTYVPTEAAVAWYHHKVPDPPADLQAFLRSAQTFAVGEYATALAQGSALSPAARDEVIHKLHGFIGISETYLRRADLRITPEEFEKQLLGGTYRILGRYDARYVGVDFDPNAQFPDYDPSYSYISAPYVATLNDYVRVELGYHTTAIYKPLTFLGDWDFHRADQQAAVDTGDVLPDLKLAMTANPRLRVFSANGYYDMATPYFATEFLIDHMGLDPSLAGHIQYGFYQSGHMVYLNTTALAAFKKDLARWYDSVLSP